MAFDLGDLHPAIVHFPIALVYAAFVFDLIALFTKRDLFQNIASWTLIITAFLLLPTALTGFFASEAYTPGDPDVFRHQNMALVTAIFLLIYALFRGYFLAKGRVYSYSLALLLGIIGVGFVTLTGELGGIVVRGKGTVLESARPEGTMLRYPQVEKE